MYGSVIHQTIEQFKAELAENEKKQKKISEEIAVLNNTLSALEIEHHAHEVRLDTLNAIINQTHTKSDSREKLNFDALSPIQQAIYEELPEHKSTAYSTNELRLRLNEMGHKMNRNTSLNKILQALESRNLATYQQKGKAYYWFKLKHKK